MTNLRSIAISATAALLLVAGAGCADNGNDPPDASSSSTAPSTPSSSAPPTDSELAAQRAEAVVRRYFVVLDELRQRPSKPLESLSTVATSSQFAAQKKLVRNERSKGLHQIGATRIAKLTVQSVNLDNSDPEAGRVPTVAVDVCWDVGDADLVNEAGTSVVNTSRPPTGWTRYSVANYHWSKDPEGGWRIASSESLEKTPCPAS